MSIIFDALFERFAYYADVLKSLMFGGWVASPTALAPCVRGLSRLQSQAAPRFELMIFLKQSIIRASPERVFGFHEQPDALERLTPPWEPTRVVSAAADLRVGSEALIETRMLGLLRVRWLARHTAYDPPRMFEDVQVKGPFKSWRHRHFVELHEKGTLLRDEIEYETPLGGLGRLAAPLLVEPRLRRLFEYRHRVTREWCEGAAQ